jgi:hypothetical protein
MYHLKYKFNKKAADKKDGREYLVYNPHDAEGPYFPNKETIKSLNRENSYYYQITAIDPGAKNCGVRVERRWITNGKVSQIETVGNVKFNFTTRLKAHNNGIDLSLTGEGGHTDTIYFTEAIKHLESWIPLISQSQYVLIETQMEVSTLNTRLGQHFITIMCTALRNKGTLPLIIEIDSRMKTRILNAPAKDSSGKKTDIKEWAIAKAYELVTRNNDALGFQALEDGKRKKDDMADVICYCEAWWMMMHDPSKMIPQPRLNPSDSSSSSQQSGSSFPYAASASTAGSSPFPFPSSDASSSPSSSSSFPFPVTGSSASSTFPYPK